MSQDDKPKRGRPITRKMGTVHQVGSGRMGLKLLSRATGNYSPTSAQPLTPAISFVIPVSIHGLG